MRDRIQYERPEGVCQIMYSSADKEKIELNLHKDPASQDRLKECLKGVVAFCCNVEECRHEEICHYFSDSAGLKEVRKKSKCDMCDVCLSKVIGKMMKKMRILEEDD